MPTADFLDLPQRSRKPRRVGLTHVLDKGLPAQELAAVLASAGAAIDIVKLGWGTAYVDPQVAAKLAALARWDVLACVGGTLMEVAWQQRKVERLLDWAEELGFACVEVSDGAVGMGGAEKRRLIELAAARFRVLAEVGSKDPSAVVDPATWAGEAAADLEAGAELVVAEGRESGTVGLYDPAGRVREDVVEALLGAADPDRLVFEAPRKDQQAWLIRRLGADVNLGNVAPGDVLGLEALRLGLRADTVEQARGMARLGR